MVSKAKGAFYLRLFALIFCSAIVVFSLFVTLVFPKKYAEIVEIEAGNFDLPPELLYAVIWTESKFKAEAISSKGAVGLMQLLPSTAEFCALKMGEEFDESDLYIPEKNIRLGAYYLRYLADKFGIENAIAAYNAGEGNLKNWIKNEGGSIKFKETREYVKRVKLAKKLYKIR